MLFLLVLQLHVICDNGFEAFTIVTKSTNLDVTGFLNPSRDQMPQKKAYFLSLIAVHWFHTQFRIINIQKETRILTMLCTLKYCVFVSRLYYMTQLHNKIKKQFTWKDKVSSSTTALCFEKKSSVATSCKQSLNKHEQKTHRIK